MNADIAADQDLFQFFQQLIVELACPPQQVAYAAENSLSGLLKAAA